MARASRKNRPGFAAMGSRVRRNAKREAARGAASVDHEAGEHAASVGGGGVNYDPPPNNYEKRQLGRQVNELNDLRLLATKGK